MSLILLSLTILSLTILLVMLVSLTSYVKKKHV